MRIRDTERRETVYELETANPALTVKHIAREWWSKGYQGPRYKVQVHTDEEQKNPWGGSGGNWRTLEGHEQTVITALVQRHQRQELQKLRLRHARR